MTDNTITIPVQALMRRQPDGSYAIVPEESEYITVPADAVAKFLVERLGIPTGEARPCN